MKQLENIPEELDVDYILRRAKRIEEYIITNATPYVNEYIKTCNKNIQITKFEYDIHQILLKHFSDVLFKICVEHQVYISSHLAEKYYPVLKQLY